MWFWLQECLKNGPGGLYNDLTVDVSTVKNIWKSYIWTADKDVSESDPRSNVHYLGSSQNSDFNIFLTVYLSLHGFIWNQHND